METYNDVHPLKFVDAQAKHIATTKAVEGSQQDRGGQHDSVNDKKDMWRLGRKQELSRRFRFFTLMSFIVTLGLTWEFSFATVVFSLSNGGTAGAIWLTFAVCCGMFLVTLSMAECASIAPTTGGQYHWISEFSPAQIQMRLSYITGWLCALGWQAAVPSVAYIGAQQIIALIALCDLSYEPKGWHASLLTMAFVLASVTFNTFAIEQLPILERVAIILHIINFFVFIIIVWTLGPNEDPETIFFHFEDNNNWGSLGLATLIAVVGPAATYAGPDAAVHLGEELTEASFVLPRAMWIGALINCVTGFVATVTIVSNLGDLDEILSSRTGQPWVAVMYNATGSRAGTIVLTLVMIFLFFFCSVNQVTGTSRQLFAFARDKGLPFHHFLSRVQPNGVPANSVYVTLASTCLLALIIIGSPIAFNIILSLNMACLYTCYLTVMLCVIAKRLRGEPFPPSKFSLGKLGLPINIASACFLTVMLVFLFFPAAPNSTALSMNWTILMYGVCFVVAGLYYVYKGHREYEGPAVLVRKEVE